jgi:iron complex outermembrane recepter protein
MTVARSLEPLQRAPAAHAQLTFAASVAITVLAAAPAGAQEADSKPLEEITVTGTRRQVLSPTDVSAPVDVIPIEQLTKQGDSDMINVLRNSVPSFNADANPLSGTPTSMRPVSLRGLSPDHVLVLVNGKRRHRGANVATFSGGKTDGSQGPDISSIPSIALGQVQVLRDGAAAQYGSDAIAGVINFILNDDPRGADMQAKYSSTYQGDGDRYQLAGTVGMPLGETGFLRFSGELHEQDESIRAIQRPDAAALQAGASPLVNPDAVPNPATNFGIPEIRDDLKLFVNLGADINDNASFYGFGNFSKRTTESDFFYRNPTDREGVYTDGRGNFLVGDMTPGDGANCEGGIDFGGTGVVNDPIVVGAPNQAARMASVRADANCFSFLELFPGGYSPRFGSDVNDMAGAMGVRGKLANGFTYDISASAGRSEISFFATNVPNPSMGAQSPTAFKQVGDRIQLEKFVNIDVSYPLQVSGFASPVNLAAGFEWHDEKFQIVAGEPASYEAGVLADQGFLIGEEAIPGFSPAIAGTFGRHNVAGYLDAEADVTDKLTLGLAARHERFSGVVGSETTFKASGMFHFTDSVAIRSTFATGFHAPSVGQEHFSTTTTEFDADGNLVESGQIPPTSPTAQIVGARPLEPETSESVSAGLVFDNGTVTLTIDAYQIEVDDRITLSASQSLTDAQKRALINEGFQAAAGFSSFRFFTNDFASRTRGVDLVATVPLSFIRSGSTELNVAVNYNETEVTSFDPNDPTELLDEVRVTQLEDNYPNLRGNVALTHTRGAWGGMLRANYYDSFTEMHVNGNLPIEAKARVTLDLEISFAPMQGFEVALGADNLLGQKPTRNPWDFIVGSAYPTTNPYGLDNGLWYLRLSYEY